MSSDGKVLEEGREEPSHETPQAITITIMDPSALETTTLDPTLVTSMQSQDTDQGMSTLLVMPREGHRTKDILQTVTETHMGTQELPVISSISNTEEESQQSTIQVMSKSQDDGEGEGILASVGEAADEEEGDEGDDLGDPLSQHCLICNLEMATTESEKPIPVFKSQTSTTHRKMAVFLGTLVGQKLTSRKAHSDIICRRCFNLLDKVDALEVEIRDTKEEIITKFQETVTAYGGRARRRKPATAKKSDYVFPKVEPEEDILGLEMDENFEPRMEDLLEEEQDHREDRTIQDEEWEPEFKRPKIKREPVEPDPNGPPKRKRGRPRKDASKPKEETAHLEIKIEGPLGGGKAEVMRGEGKRPIKAKYSQDDYQVIKPKRRTRQRNSGTQVYLDEPLSCSECGQLFNNEPLYKIHCTEAHIDSKAVKCPHCPLVFDKRHELDSHLINHTPTNHACAVCAVGFPTAILLIKHLKDVHPDTANTCPRCDATFINEDQLKFHFEQKHRRGRRKGHSFEKEDVPVNSVVCVECGKVCNNMIAYQTHKYNEHIHLFPHECKVCCRRFSKESYLESHLKTHIDGWLECVRCGVKFGNESHLVDHMYYVHGQKKGLMCSVCNRLFSTATSLKTHREMEHREHLDCNEVCGICGEKYPSKIALKRHMMVHNRDHQCSYCGKKLSSKAALDVHVNMVHTKEHSFVCPHCNREFYAKHLLQMHVKRVHSDRSDFQYRCKLCGKVYLQEWELTLHHKTHTNERNYKCDVCGDAFYTISRMRYHRATHKATRDSECPMCTQMFRRDVDTKNHLRRVHKILHPGHFMELCARFGKEKARELQMEVVNEKGGSLVDEDGSEHITLYRVEEEQEPPVQVIIPDAMEMMVLDPSMDVSATSETQEENVTYVYEMNQADLKHEQQIISIIKIDDFDS
ncbi:zinc finger and SCAN domain-containing protein 2-like isoform X3 [Penaeus monodon]|uniref:zinc finger and SCAN domain-containing protein 2-like isoform X3 n=1 Tax=Penaeus monodon TaxID=6687 RepID=UPI0018A7042E|nr:zinc finger and SCAN domain-containing protein 2-like isoform X3 [Penaeus monodon]